MFKSEELSAGLTTHFKQTPLAQKNGQAVDDVVRMISDHVARHYPATDEGKKTIDHFVSSYAKNTPAVALWTMEQIARLPHRDQDEKKEYHRRYTHRMKKLEFVVALCQSSGGPQAARSSRQWAFLFQAADAMHSLLATLSCLDGDDD